MDEIVTTDSTESIDDSADRTRIVPANRNTFCRSIGREFQRKFLWLNFSHPDAFTTSQWHWPCWVFVIYRLIVATYSIIVIIFSIISFNHSMWTYPWPVWLTNWSYFMLTCHLICSAVVSLFRVYDCRRNRMKFLSHETYHINEVVSELPFYLKLSWFLFVVASASAVLVTLVYFVAIFPFSDVHQLDEENIQLHLMNCVIVVLEVSISGIPVRLLHFVYVAAYCCIYVAFSVVCWAFDNSRVLYPGVLDWNYPAETLGIIVLLGLVGLPLLQFFLFSCYQLRLYVYKNIYSGHF